MTNTARLLLPPSRWGAARRALGVWLIVSMAFGGPSAFATDYYVSAITGNDANPGTTPALPWKTLTRALNTTATPAVTAGDNVNVLPGTYNAANGEVFPLSLVNGVAVLGPTADPVNGLPPTAFIAGGNAGRMIVTSGTDLNSSTRLSGFGLTNNDTNFGSDVIFFDVGANTMSPQIDHNAFTGFLNGAAGVAVRGQGAGGSFTGTISNNTFQDFNYGVLLSDSVGDITPLVNFSPTVSGNTFTNNTIGVDFSASEVLLTGTETATYGPIITGNTFTGGSYGVYVSLSMSGATGTATFDFTPLVSNNTFSGMTTAAIYMSLSASTFAQNTTLNLAPQIKNNPSITNITGDGIDINVSLTAIGNAQANVSPTISGNSLSTISNAAIVLSTSVFSLKGGARVTATPTISGNTISGTGRNGITMSEKMTASTSAQAIVKPTISGNTISGAGISAVSMSASIDARGSGIAEFSPTISNNTISDSSYGMYFYWYFSGDALNTPRLTSNVTMTGNKVQPPGSSASSTGAGTTVGNALDINFNILNWKTLDANWMLTGNSVNTAAGEGIEISNTYLHNNTGNFNLTVSGNSVTNTPSNGINVSLSESTAANLSQKILIDGNTVTGVFATGIRLSISGGESLTADDIQITNNVMDTNGQGLYVMSNTFGPGVTNAVLVSCNTITGSVGDGVIQGSVLTGPPSDFGGGNRLSPGGNQIFGNGSGSGTYDFNNQDQPQPLESPIAPVAAQNNWWGTIDPITIDSHIHDDDEDATVRPVDFSNFKLVAGGCAVVNTAPVAKDDAYPATEDTLLTVPSPGVLGNDTDVNGNPLSAVLDSGPTSGTLTLNPNGSFTYQPFANFNGTDSFTYHAFDGSLPSNVATVTITVAPVDDAPVANNDTYGTNQNTPLNVPAPGVLTNDTDIDSPSLTAIPMSGPSNGTLTLNSNGSFLYTPNAGFVGTDTFTYEASDGSVTSNIATVSILVNNVNDPPIASADSYTTAEDTTLNVAAPGVLGNDTDPDGDPMTAVLNANPAHGTLTLNSNGSFTYVPFSNYNGSDSFTYHASDGTLGSAVTTVTLTITPVNDAPVANSDSMSVAPGASATAPVAANDTDVDGDPLTITSFTQGSQGTVSCTTPNCTYTANLTAAGTDSFTYTISDGKGGTATGTVNVTISPASADLRIVKTGPAAIPANGVITFRITVKNVGPSPASNITINDRPGTGLRFVSNAGACTTPFPCSVASLAVGASVIIDSTFNASGSQSVTNTATVSSTTSDPAGINNSSTVTVGVPCPTEAPELIVPFSGQTDVPVNGSLQWTAVGATTYQVFLGPAGTGCSNLAGTSSTTSFPYTGLTPGTDYEARIVATKAGCPSSPASQCIRFRTAQPACSVGSPQIISPATGSTVSSPISLQWTAVSGAASYHVIVVVNAKTVVDNVTPNTSETVTIPSGPASWSVSANAGNCSSAPATSTFNVCNGPDAPLAGVVGAPSSGRTYAVQVVDAPPDFVRYDFDEATNDQFTDAKTTSTTSSSVFYTHDATSPSVFFYRVRAYNNCTTDPGAYSKTIRVVVVPLTTSADKPVVNVPAGTKDLVIQKVFIPGDGVAENFTASADRPWIVKINPASGILPPNGLIVDVTIDPAQLPNGTFTATIIVTVSPAATGKKVASSTGKSVPVTINLVTPVVPVNPTGPTANSLIVPVVGRLLGLNSQWRSDLRIYNASPQALKYQLNFVQQGVTDVKQTSVVTASGDTTALDDIIHNWYGFGEVGDNATGVLEVRPMTTAGDANPPGNVSLATVVSSRTFDLRADGTVGQFIPAVKFTNFAGGGSTMSMQQLAQSSSYRTNFGLYEASGTPVSLVLSLFNSAGTKLFDLPVSLAGGEQKMLNGLLAEHGVTSLSDGRMEVKVDGGGKVTAYASVIDNASLDPQLVPAQNLGGSSSKLYVVPGVADLHNGGANWQTDMRVYNSAGDTQTANLTFFPQDNSSAPITKSVNVNVGEVKVLDNIVQSLFATANLGGVVQVTTAGDSQLVVTARTYNQTANGTLGQFIKATTTNDAVGSTSRALNILQVEDSPRFHTNVGLAEMSGKPATAEISVILPDSKVTATIDVPLAANEFRQFAVSQFGLGNVYNARVSVKVIDGAGSLTAYGSVIDQTTTDPTYVQAQ